jgi:hypothetical protein
MVILPVRIKVAKLYWDEEDPFHYDADICFLLAGTEEKKRFDKTLDSFDSKKTSNKIEL